MTNLVTGVPFSGTTNSNGIYTIPTNLVALTDIILGVGIDKGHYCYIGLTSNGSNQAIRIVDVRGDAVASGSVSGTIYILNV